MIDNDAAISERLEWLDELKLSKGYALVRQRIFADLERSRDAIERNISPESTSVLRGWISACRMVLNIPDILEEELKTEHKKEES